MSGWPRGVGSEALSVAPVTELCSPQVGGVTVMTLYSEAPDENAKQVVEWMEEGVFKAMNDGYLVRTACQWPSARAHTTHASTPRTQAHHARTHALGGSRAAGQVRARHLCRCGGAGSARGLVALDRLVG